MEAESRRGNPARLLLHEHQLRGDPPQAYFKYPMDRAAVEAEFDLGDRVRPVGTPGQGLSGYRDVVTDCFAYDGHGTRGWWARRRLADWWAEWQVNARPRRRLGNGDGG